MAGRGGTATHTEPYYGPGCNYACTSSFTVVLDDPEATFSTLESSGVCHCEIQAPTSGECSLDFGECTIEATAADGRSARLTLHISTAFENCCWPDDAPSEPGRGILLPLEGSGGGAAGQGGSGGQAGVSTSTGGR
ncbi:MAG TPA: hypothetical protein VGP93_19105 [Polyangiaceae bacterium]|jgi:hypothetical protein|nr:hypothetical protein [Polyangiaceae bacterium]